MATLCYRRGVAGVQPQQHRTNVPQSSGAQRTKVLGSQSSAIHTHRELLRCVKELRMRQVHQRIDLYEILISLDTPEDVLLLVTMR